MTSGDARPSRYRSLWPLPGGARHYIETLRLLLGIAEGRPSPEEFLVRMRHLPGVQSRRPSRGYLSVLSNLGLVERRSGRVVLTRAGERRLHRGDLRVQGEALRERILGVAEILTALDRNECTFEELRDALRRAGITWRGPMQLRYRIWWLQAAGLIETGGMGPGNARRLQKISGRPR